MVVDEGVVRDFVERRIEEQEAAAELAADTEPPAPAPPPPPPPDVDESRYVVDVRNASGASGLAAQVSDQLREAGFVRGSVDNAAASPTSVVRYSGSDGDAARAVASRLGGIAVEAGETHAGSPARHARGRLRPGRRRERCAERGPHPGRRDDHGGGRTVHRLTHRRTEGLP